MGYKEMQMNMNKRMVNRKWLVVFIGLLCFSLFLRSAYALGDYDVYNQYNGDGWSMSANGVMTIESDQGWANCIKHGYKSEVKELIIGKDVTIFRVYQLPNDLPCPDFFDTFEVAGYDKNGEPYYDFNRLTNVFPMKITIEAGNQTFQVLNGLLINMKTGELVLSEMDITDVIIPEGVKAITRNAFAQRDLLSVHFPSTLETIGENAFYECDGLQSIVLPDSLISLKTCAFVGCQGLREVSMPSRLQELGAYAFSRCPIQSIEIPETVEEIGAFAFLDCDQLLQVSLPEGLRKIKTGTFSGCDQLQQINFPDQLQSIGEQAFCGCYSLKQVILPDSLQEIGNKAFWRCNLSVLRIPEKLIFPIYSFKRNEFIINPNSKSDKTFGLSSAETVILSGSDYDFGYPAINGAKNVYFLGLPPTDVGDILDSDTTENIYCSENYEFEWTRSTVASWVRQRLTILPADQIKKITEQEINTTPEPTNTPKPTYGGMKLVNTPKPTATLAPTVAATDVPELKPEQQGTDPLVFAFAGILALVIAGIVVVVVKSGKPKKRAQKRK